MCCNSGSSVLSTTVSLDTYIVLYCISDQDECGSNNGNCEQVCRNRAGSFICDCFSGFVLNDDKKTCSGENVQLFSSLFKNGHLETDVVN